MLIYQCVWLTHYDCWFCQVFSCRVINTNFFIVSARKEHAVKADAIVTLDIEMLSFEISVKEELVLIYSSEHPLEFAEASSATTDLSCSISNSVELLAKFLNLLNEFVIAITNFNPWQFPQDMLDFLFIIFVLLAFSVVVAPNSVPVTCMAYSWCLCFPLIDL